MAETSTGPQRRSNADKERSRQQSRNVSGKEAAKSVGGGRGGRPTSSSRPAAAPAPRKSNTRGKSGGAGRRPPGGRPPARRRSSGGFGRWIWAGAAVVVVVVLVVVLVSVTSSSNNTKAAGAGPVSPQLLRQITKIKSSVYDSVGTGSSAGVTAPKLKTGLKPLTYTGKPGIIYVGGEFCPYCAAERWAVIASLSRFGTFSGLQTMSSSPYDVDASTPTFTFNKATYTSTYVTAKLIEYYGQASPTGSHPIINPLSKAIQTVVDKASSTSATSSGTGGVSIPFIDFGNKVVQSGSSYTPTILAGLTQEQVASQLSDPTSKITQAIVGTSNYFSATICNLDGTQPSDVCSSSGVTAAAKALKLST